jgi:hypothetical protein
LLSDQTLALAVGSLGIFIFDCRDCDHLAVITFAAQPTEKGAFEQLGVETVGLGAPVFTRYRYARCVDYVGLDAARPKPARQPRSILRPTFSASSRQRSGIGEHLTDRLMVAGDIVHQREVC